MKLVNQLFKNIPYLDREKLSQLMREEFSFSNIHIEEKMFFSSTSYYLFKNKSGVVSKDAFPLKLFIPDFIIENFSLHDRDQKKLILDFLKIFIKEIIYINYNVEINKTLYIYTSSVKEHHEDEDFFRNRRNMILFFERFFTEKIHISEYIPKKIKNNQQFVLGKNYLFSNISHKNYLIGNSFLSFLNRISVKIEIHHFEIENLKEFFKIIGMKNASLIFSCQRMEKICSYKFNFIFENKKCISAFSIPNFPKQVIKLGTA